MKYQEQYRLIAWSQILTLCPNEALAFQSTLSKYGMDALLFADHYRFGDSDEDLIDFLEFCYREDEKCGECGDTQNDEGIHARAVAEASEMVASWQALMKAFQKATTVEGSHLSLCIGRFRSPDDDVEEECYMVHGMFDNSADDDDEEDCCIKHGVVNDSPAAKHFTDSCAAKASFFAGACV